MPPGSLALAHHAQTPRTTFSTAKACLPALLIAASLYCCSGASWPSLFTLAAKERRRPTSNLSTPSQKSSQDGAMAKEGLKGSKFKRDMRQSLLPAPSSGACGTACCWQPPLCIRAGSPAQAGAGQGVGFPAAQLSPAPKEEGRKELPPGRGSS